MSWPSPFLSKAFNAAVALAISLASMHSVPVHIQCLADRIHPGAVGWRRGRGGALRIGCSGRAGLGIGWRSGRSGRRRGEFVFGGS